MNYLICTPSPQSISKALLDSLCTDHLLIANAHCKNKQLAQSSLEVCLPNGPVIASTQTATLDLPSFPTGARQDHVLPGLDQHCLLSVGKMRDSGCVTTFTANKVAVKNGAATSLTGTGDKDSILW
jgi:hypothetical protein